MSKKVFLLICAVLITVLFVQVYTLIEIVELQDNFSNYEGSTLKESLESLEHRVEELISE